MADRPLAGALGCRRASGQPLPSSVVPDGSTYPPERHFLRDLRLVTTQLEGGRSRSTAPIDEAVRNRAGHAALGFVSAIADVAAASTTLAAVHPDWTATADLALSSARPISGDHLIVDALLERIGSKLIVVRVAASDDRAASSPDQRPAMTGVLSFARLPGSASRIYDRIEVAASIGQPRGMELFGEVTPGTIAERMNLTTVDAARGFVELPRDEYVNNSFRAINGGVLGVVFQAAAEAMLPEMVASDLQIHYLRQATTGPLRTRGSVLRAGREHAVCTIEAVDAGHEDAVLALATVTLQRF